MDKLEELYKERLKQHEEYVTKKIAYDTRIQDYVDRTNNLEASIKTALKELPADIYCEIEDILPNLEERCTKDNLSSRLNSWRLIYAKLRQKGMSLLNET